MLDGGVSSDGLCARRGRLLRCSAAAIPGRLHFFEMMSCNR